MKKYTRMAILAAACLLSLLLTSCGGGAPIQSDIPKNDGSGDNLPPTDSGDHVHEWYGVHDEVYHWNTCGICYESSEKAEHNFDDGKVTTPATADGDGVMTYTCGDCGYQKVRAIQFVLIPTVSAEEWAGAFELFGNCSISITEDTYRRRTDGVWVSYEKGRTVGTHYFAENAYRHVGVAAEKIYISDGTVTEFSRSLTEEGASWSQGTVASIPDGMASDELSLLRAIKDSFSSFEYSGEDMSYIAEDIAVGGKEYKSISVRFENGKFSSLTYPEIYTAEEEGAQRTYRRETVLFFDSYGTTAIVSPVN